MAKKNKIKGFKKSKKEWEEWALKRANNFVDKLSPRDVIYAATFGVGTYLAYGICPGSYPIWQRKERFDPGALCFAMLATYMVMRVDVRDLASAFGAISGAIT